MKAKKLFAVLLSVLLVLSAFPTFALFTVSAADTGVATVYVSSAGNDSTGDGTQANPYASISKAEEIIEANSSANAGEIIMLTDMTFTSATHTKMITIKGATGAENLNQTGKVKSVAGPTTFKDFTINDTTNIATNGNDVIYENITFTGSKGTFYFGNIDSSVTTPNNITLNGFGKKVNLGANVRIGPLTSGASASTNATNGTINSDINIVVNSGYFNQFWMLNGTYNGDLNVTLNGAKMYNNCQFDFYGVNKSTYNGAFQLLLNNGFATSNVYVSEVEKINAAEGSWFMYCDNSGGMLSTTNTPGTFAVNEGYNAIATNTSTGAKYKSAKRTLTVPAGKYEVTYEVASSEEDDDLKEVVFYVSANGNDSDNGLTAETPFATIAQAETVIEASNAESGQIIMLTDMTFTSAPHTKMITIKGATGAENLTKPSGNIMSAAGPTTFKDFSINDTFKIATDGNEVIYENITFTGTKGMFYFGNIDSSVTTPNNITLNGLGLNVNKGANVRIGPATRQGVMNSDLNVVVNKGYFYQFWVHEGTYNGNVSFTFNGGTVYGTDPFLDPYTNYTTTYNGAYQVILNNGFSSSKISPSVDNITAAGGKWLMYCDDSGGMLSTTDIPGTFNVNGTFSAIATNVSTGVSYSSSKGVLTVPAGKYNVSFGYAANDVSTFYVSANGNDSNDGLTPETAFATIDHAQAWLNYSTATDKTIIVSGEVGFDGGQAHEDMITIKGDGTASLIYDTTGQYDSQIYGHIALQGPTTFANIALDETKLLTNGNEMVLGDDITPLEGKDSYYYVGNKDNSSSSEKAENVTINSFASNLWKGAFVRIGAFGNNSDRAMGDVNLTINGGRFRQLQFWQAVINGNVSIVWNGGTISKTEGSEYSTSVHDNTVFNGAVQFIMNKGISEEVLGEAFTDIDAAEGVWYIYCNDTADGGLVATDIAGLYAFDGANYARAVNRETGEVFYSYEGELDLSAEDGIYDVTLYDSIHFGDINGDGAISIIDLIAIKKLTMADYADYFWAADVDEDLEINSLDLTIIKKHLLGVENIVWQSSNAISLIDGSDLTFGGAESEAAAMKATIDSLADTVKSQSGTKYYVSENGDDSNSGTSSDAPVKTIAKVNTLTKSGSIVLFERGGIYRTEEPLDLKDNVKVGAYGTGAKPIISGSIKNYAESTVWTSDDGTIWQTEINKDNLGGVVFDNGAYIGNRKNDIKLLVSNGDYYYEDGILYLFLDQYKPSAYFTSIEVSTTPHLIYETKFTKVSNIKIENIEFTQASLTAVDFHECSNITITGCKLSWIGGATNADGVRYGNAIQFWNSIETASVTNCHIYQIYDAAFTLQGHSDSNSYRNVTFSNNLVEYSSYNLELWCYNLEGDGDGYDKTAVMNNITVSNNIWRYSGYGFGKQRSATYSQAYILCYGFEPDNIWTFNVSISNNIFDCARSYYFSAYNAYDDFTFSNNTYYQSTDCAYPIIRNDLDTTDDVIPTNLSQFTTAIQTVDTTATVNWITR